MLVPLLITSSSHSDAVKNRIFLIILVIVIVALAAVLLAPLSVLQRGSPLVWWFARQEGFVATIDRVDAPFLRPLSFVRFTEKRP